MKNVLSVILLICMVSIVQGCAIHTTKATPSSEVIRFDNSQNELYIKANNWAVDTFKNADSVIQFSDKESGTISGRYFLGNTRSVSVSGKSVYATVKIKVKDGAGKIIVTPESFTYPVGDPYTTYTEEAAKKDIKALIVSFKRAMVTKVDNDW